MLAPGERLDIWVDFSNIKDLSNLKLLSYPLVAGLGQPFPLVNFNFSKVSPLTASLPINLSSIKKIELSEAVNSDSPKQFAVSMGLNFKSLKELQVNIKGLSIKAGKIRCLYYQVTQLN